jgi:murein L,D-transpeptidase YcbB/YkuD
MEVEDEQAKRVKQAQPDAKHNASPETAARHDLLALQQSLGNAALGRLVEQEGIATARRQASQEPMTATPAAVDAEIEARGGQGQPLDARLRERMEDELGADLEDVRIHTGPEAESLSAALGAAAFTRGQDLFFGHRMYDPESSTGEAVLAHELTHAAEQQAGPVGVQRIAGALPPLTSKPTLSPGSRGPAVIELQTLLNQVSCEHHPALALDGNFEMKTTVAVACFQWRMGLTIDGVVGAGTWTALQLMAASAGAETEPPEREEM